MNKPSPSSSIYLILTALTSILGLFNSQTALARVFDFKTNAVAAYFRGSAGPSGMEMEAFEFSSGSTNTFENQVEYNFSAELGFLISFKEAFTLRIGAEFIQAKPLNEIPGNNAAGEKVFDLTSKLGIFNTSATAEINFASSSTTRFFFFAGIGLANISLDNEYALTAQGNIDHAGLADFKESSSQYKLTSHTGVGYEFLFVDNITMSLEVGYRFLEIDGLEYKEDVTTFSGDHTKDTTLVNDTNDPRRIDMSSPFIGLSFRFYLQGT